VTTRVARTLVDLAGVLPAGRIERAVDGCLSDGIVTVDALRHVTDQLSARGRTGIALMRGLLAERSGSGYVAATSELEARFLRIVRRAGLPEPVRQLNVGGRAWIGRVDFAYPGACVLIELDGRRYHSAKLDLESDRLRDNRLVAAGWRVMRVTWDQVHRHPDEVVSLVRRALRRSGRVSGPSVTRKAPRTAEEEGVPEGVDLAAEVVEGAVVGDDVVGVGQAGGPVGLGGEAPSYVGLGHAPTLHQPADGQVIGSVDHHDGVGPVPSHLHEQRDHDHDHVVGGRLRRQPAVDGLQHRWVHQGLEVAAGGGFGEDQVGQGPAVDLAVAVDDARPEALDHRLVGRPARRNDLVGDGVGVHHDRSVVGQEARHRGFS
jgi:very-short-patch-repair endonuclease